jgi:hypothetical protein
MYWPVTGNIMCKSNTYCASSKAQQKTHLCTKNFLKPLGEAAAGLLVWAITNIGHKSATLKLSPDPRVNTLGPLQLGLTQILQFLCGLLNSFKRFFTIFLISNRTTIFKLRDGSVQRESEERWTRHFFSDKVLGGVELEKKLKPRSSSGAWAVEPMKF